ncbi:MAG: NUDIX hydrolase [Sciscionella sp.]
MPQIVACAVIGREHDVLVIRRPDGGWALPGAPVGQGERVEDALDRGLREVLGTGVASASFLCLIEDPDGLFVVFDVTAETDNADTLLPDEDQPDRVWAGLDQLTAHDLRPAILATVLHNGEPPAWLPHEPGL